MHIRKLTAGKWCESSLDRVFQYFLEPSNPSINISVLHTFYCFPGFETLKLQKGRLGAWRRRGLSLFHPTFFHLSPSIKRKEGEKNINAIFLPCICIINLSKHTVRKLRISLLQLLMLPLCLWTHHLWYSLAIYSIVCLTEILSIRLELGAIVVNLCTSHFTFIHWRRPCIFTVCNE